MSIEKCRLIEIPKISDPRGNLSFIQQDLVPFAIQRVYYLYDVPAGESRAGHAHRQLEQLLVAVAGSFDVKVDDGVNKKTFHLNRPYQALYLSSYIWRELENFSSGSVCMVLASQRYNEADYYREYADFINMVKQQNMSSN